MLPSVTFFVLSSFFLCRPVREKVGWNANLDAVQQENKRKVREIAPQEWVIAKWERLKQLEAQFQTYANEEWKQDMRILEGVGKAEKVKFDQPLWSTIDTDSYSDSDSSNSSDNDKRNNTINPLPQSPRSVPPPGSERKRPIANTQTNSMRCIPFCHSPPSPLFCNLSLPLPSLPVFFLQRML